MYSKVFPNGWIGKWVDLAKGGSVTNRVTLFSSFRCVSNKNTKESQ